MGKSQNNTTWIKSMRPCHKTNKYRKTNRKVAQTTTGQNNQKGKYQKKVKQKNGATEKNNNTRQTNQHNTTTNNANKNHTRMAKPYKPQKHPLEHEETKQEEEANKNQKIIKNIIIKYRDAERRSSRTLRNKII